MADPRFESEPRPLIGVADRHATAAASTLTVRVAVTNAAVAPRVLSVTAVGVDATWTEGPARTGVLEPGGTDVVELRITPPQGTLPASYPLVVAVQALDPATGAPTAPTAGTAETVLVVNPRSQLSLEVTPRQLTLIATRRFTVELRNTGAAPAKVKLLLKSGSHVAFSLARQEVEVRPGDVVKVRGRARAKRPATIGPRMVHSFTLTARGTETMKHVEGHVVQKPMISTGILKVVGLVLVLAVWVAAAVVFVPTLADKVQTSSEEQAAETAPGADATDAGAEDPAAGGEDGGSEDGGDGGGDDAAGEDDDASDGLLLSGNVTGDAPADTNVHLQRISLVSESVEGATGVGVPADEIGGTGLRPAAAMTAAPADETDLSVVAGDDGAWSFPPVPPRGYYLVEFTKPGFETERYVVDSSSAAAAEPLEVDLVPGQGSLSGRIVGRDGKPVGGATVTVSDGTHTVTTNSNSEDSSSGAVGSWEIQGLSTPSTYVVSATKYAMSSEARVVDVAAGGDGTADLTLVPGVAALSGLVTKPGSGDARKLTGVTVTVTDGEGLVRATTTLSSLGVRGQYTLPALPSPGSYTVTASRPGYQSETRPLELTKGQAREGGFDFELNTATGTLVGTVAEPATTTTAANRTARKAATGAAVASAGLTLTNADHTYKSMSGRDGGYAMAGITPGDYVLSTEFYGKSTSFQNVTIEAGDPTTLDVSLADAPGRGLSTTAAIRGSVIDATTGEQLTAACATPETACLTASVTPQTVDGDPARDTITTSFAAADGFSLAQGADGLQLGPGLHRVTVRAPGYEAGTVDVRVLAGKETETPLVEMYPAPTITGIVTAAAGDVDYPTSCVYVFQGSVNPADLDTLNPGCGDPAPAPCRAGSTSYDGVDATSRTWCAVTDATGHYEVQVPASGAYTVFVKPRAKEYIPTALRSVTLARAESFQYNPIVDRYGEIALTVMVPGPGQSGDENLVHAPEHTPVVVKPSTEIGAEFETDDQGKVVISGLRGRQRYEFTAAVERPQPTETDPYTTLKGSASAEAAINDTAPLEVQAIDPVPGFVGRVTSTLDDSGAPLTDLDVTLEAALTYTSGGAAVYDLPFTPTTDALGCFAIASADRPEREGVCRDVDRSLTGVDTWGTAIKDRKVATNQIKSITIKKPGFTDGVWSYQQLSTLKVNELQLDPAPVPFAVTLGLNPATPGLGATVDWGGKQTPGDPTDDVTITLRDGGHPSRTGPVTLGLAPQSGDARVGQLSWDDLQVKDGSGNPLPGQIRPGTYHFDVKAPGSYTSLEDQVLTCAVGGVCTWNGTTSSRLALQQRGDLTIAVKGSDNAILPATLKLTGGVTLGGATNDSGTITFTRLGVQTITNPVVEVSKAAGYLSGATNDADVRRPVLTCDGSTTPATAIVIRAGDTTSCTVTMRHKLATINGTLKGILGPETTPVPTDPAGIDYLANRTVQLQRCTTSACTAIEFAMTRTTSLADATNADHPNGARFSFSGTAENEFKPGTYLLSVPDVPAGYAAPQNTLRNATVVTVSPTDEVVEADAYLWAKPVAVDVRLTDQHGAQVSDATVYAHRRDVSSAGVDSDTHTGATPGTNRYPLPGLVPGRTVFWVTGPGLAPQGQAQKVLAQPTGSGQTLDLVVARDGQRVDGTVETTVSSTTHSVLGDVRVTLTCNAGTTTPAAFCPAGQPALGTDRQPLVTTSDASGHYLFTSVPVGTFTATFSKRGYLTAPLAAPVQVLPSPRDPDGVLTLPLMNIAGVARDVQVSVSATHADPDSAVGPVKVELIGVHGTPTSYSYTVTSRDTDRVWKALLPQVRWGCYDVVVTPGPAWQGTAEGPTGSPSQPDLGCGDADLVVPDTSEDQIDLSYVLHGGRVAWAFSVHAWSGHRLPPVTLTATNGTTTRTFSTVGTGGATTVAGGAFLPAGQWTVSATVPEDDAAYWTISSAATVTVVDGQDVALPITLTEATFEVTIRMPSIPTADLGTAKVQITAANGQDGDDPVPSIITVPASRVVTLMLPRGPWQFEGSWSTSPLPTTYTVVAGTATREVVVGPDTPPPTPPTDPSDDPTP